MTILQNVKQYMGYDVEDPTFDIELSMLIDSELIKLYEIGLGNPNVSVMTNQDLVWGEFLGDTEGELNYKKLAKSFVCVSVRLIFDPSSSATVTKALKDYCDGIYRRLRTESIVLNNPDILGEGNQ